MKILYLSNRPPHARSMGGLLIVYHRIRRLLERGHDVGLSVLYAKGEERYLAEWESRGIDLCAFPMPEVPTGWRGKVSRLRGGVPHPFHAYKSEAMLRGVGDMVERGKYEVAVAEFSVMGQYLHHNPWLPAVRKIISSHQSLAALRYADLPQMGFRPAEMREWRRAQRRRRYELELFRSVDRILVFNREERFLLLSRAPDLHVNVVPCSVDAGYFHPPQHPVSERILLFTGNYIDDSNRDAVLWFAREVWPKLKRRYPDLRFQVVGPEPSAQMRELARTGSGIEVTGEVDDVRPYLNHARVYVCPVRKGLGMRMKILEAMASGIPVVATTLAAKGIPAQVGENCFLADDPGIMINCIDLLLNDTPLCAAIARRARDMVVERFTWEQSVGQLERIFHDVVTGG